MRVRLKDIAEVTGVSINTVSRSLRDMPDIGADTKQRVQAVASELGYLPNIQARGLVNRRSCTVGLIATELANPSRAAMVEALRQVAMHEDYQLVVRGFDGESDAGACIRDMVSRGVDGLVIGNISGELAQNACWPDLQAAAAAGVPFVVFFEAVSATVNRVGIDYEAIMHELTRHLITAHGHRAVAYLGVECEIGRGRGYLRAMESAGLAASVQHIPVRGWTVQAAKQGVIDFVAGNRPPAAIVCHNDTAAFGAMAGLRACGLEVPGDVAVVGVDNMELSAYTNPPLTTAGTHPTLAAEILFRALNDLMSASEPARAARSIALPVDVFLRESCGCTRQDQASL